MSLSSKSEQWFAPLHALADEAYFKRVVLVCAANNLPGPTYPSEYASVLSVAPRESSDPFSIAYNPNPPVEFGACGIDVDVAWNGGTSISATGNSFATPHLSGLAALLLSKHPELTPFQVKATLLAMADNARETPERWQAVDVRALGSVAESTHAGRWHHGSPWLVHRASTMSTTREN